MTYSQACVDLVKEFEGLRLESYRCLAGIWTIGYGHTRRVTPEMRIDRARAEQLLDEDLDATAGAVSAAVHVPLTQGHFDALVCFAFNCRDWRGSTLIRLVNAGNFTAAAAQFPSWDHVAHVEVAGLRRRRLAEMALFLGQGVEA